jgi:hypothetical protein
LLFLFGIAPAHFADDAVERRRHLTRAKLPSGFLEPLCAKLFGMNHD